VLPQINRPPVFSRWFTFLSACLLSLFLAACGSNDDEPAPATGGTVTPEDGSTPAIPPTTDTKPSRALAARFNAPRGIAADSNGNLYVADTDNITVRKITPSGGVSTIAGTAGQFGTVGAPPVDGVGAAARFNVLTGITVDTDGNLYVTDTFLATGRIRKIAPDGTVTTRLESIYGLGIVSDPARNLFVARNAVAASIDRIPPDGPVTEVATLQGPRGITRDAAGNLYVTNTGRDFGPLGQAAFSCTIEKITPAGTVTTLAGSRASGEFDNTCGSADGAGAAAKISRNAHALTIDASDNLYVADTGNHTIRKVTPAGLVTTLAGTAGQSGAIDGTGAAARFNAPQGITIDAAGNLYVADTGNHTVRKVTQAGAVTTIAGKAGESGSTDVPE
jgi:sugar lactone lactonase YvrE